MGVEYRHYLIPRPNTFYPRAEQLAALVAMLADENWIAAPGSEALRKMAQIDELSDEDAAEIWAEVRLSTGRFSAPRSLTAEWFQGQLSDDLRLEFPVQHGDRVALQYPLINDSGPPDDPYYEIEMHLSREYVHHVSELIEPASTVCRCGESLEFDVEQDIFYASRITSQCPRCGKIFDPSSVDVVVRDGWTGDKSLIKGGAIYRFAIIIDCGKCIPERKAYPIKANPKLVDLCRSVFRTEFYEVGDIY